MGDIMEKKLKTIRTLKSIFTIITIIVGIITIIDFIVPDPVLFIDEAFLASITGLLTIITSTLDDKEKEIINGNKVNIKPEEISNISVAVGDVTKNIKRIKKNK